MGGDNYPLTLPPPWTADDISFEEIIEFLREMGMDVVQGDQEEGVIVEEDNGLRFLLPKNFNIFTNPVKIPME